MNNIFLQLATVLGFASLFGYLMKRLSLPLLVAYLLVGVLVSTLSVFNFNSGALSILPEIGIAFVLFLIGMELDLREFGSFGKPIIISGLIQIFISALAGYTIASLFGFSGFEPKYLGIGLSFSSTVVVVKMLLERRDLTSLYGKLSIGILLLEDLVAMVVLMLLSVSGAGFSLGPENSVVLVNILGKGLFLLVLTFILSKYVLAKIFKAVANSQELLFLTALTWCFVFISVSLLINLSVVIGAFLAGIALASSPYHFAISSKIKPLRDFFIVLFFVYLGAQVNILSALANLPIILVFTSYAVLFKPFIFSLLFGSFGFRKHTIFQAAINMSQISEFSLIILLFGVRLNVLSSNVLSILAFSVVLSIIASSIMISHSKALYAFLRPALSFFERESKFNALEERVETILEDHVVVIGANNIGGPIVEFLSKEKIPFMVLDFDPKVVERLHKNEVLVVYGDVADTEVLENLNLKKAKLVISTASDPDDNRILLTEIKRQGSGAKVVVRAEEEDDIEELKKKGADYIILPESVSADFLVNQLEHHWPKIHFGRLKNLV